MAMISELFRQRQTNHDLPNVAEAAAAILVVLSAIAVGREFALGRLPQGWIFALREPRSFFPLMVACGILLRNALSLSKPGIEDEVRQRRRPSTLSAAYLLVAIFAEPIQQFLGPVYDFVGWAHFRELLTLVCSSLAILWAIHASRSSLVSGVLVIAAASYVLVLHTLNYFTANLSVTLWYWIVKGH